MESGYLPINPQKGSSKAGEHEKLEKCRGEPFPRSHTLFTATSVLLDVLGIFAIIDCWPIIENPDRFMVSGNVLGFFMKSGHVTPACVS
jgi:hypothetical protein